MSTPQSPNFTPENEDLSREHIQALINDNLTPEQIREKLEDLGHDAITVNKIVSDLGSYSKPGDQQSDDVE